MKNRVLIIKTDDYSYDIKNLKNIIAQGLDFVFGNNYFQNKQKVLIKPNLLTVAQPEDAITTHPNFIVAAALALKDKGPSVFLADNPAGIGSNKSIKEIYSELGLERYSEYFRLLYNDRRPFIKKGLPFSWWVQEFEEIVNLPKLKTHTLMGLTAAIKNVYGLLPGIIKSKLHKKYPRPYNLAKIIVEIYKMYQPSVNILDGIITLEGQGPARGGTTKKRGIIFISNSALALDFALAKFIKIDPQKLPYLKIALQEKMIDPSTIEIYPENWKDLVIEDFVFAGQTLLELIPKPIAKILDSFLNYRPFIKGPICRSCQKCMQICPVSALEVKGNEKVVINYKKCIMCMCCQEICPYGAVQLQYSTLMKLLIWILK